MSAQKPNDQKKSGTPPEEVKEAAPGTAAAGPAASASAASPSGKPGAGPDGGKKAASVPQTKPDATAAPGRPKPKDKPDTSAIPQGRSAPVEPDAPGAPDDPASGGKGLGLPALIVAIAGSLGAATISSWGPATIGYPAPDTGAERIMALETQVGSLASRLTSLDQESLPPLEERLARLEDMPAWNPADIGALGARLNSLEAAAAQLPVADAAPAGRLDGLEGRIEGLEGGMANIEGRVSAMQSAVEQFDGRLGEASSAISAMDADIQTNASLVLAVDAVRAALSDGQPFTEMMPSLRGLAEGAPELAPALALLSEHSDGSLVTRRQLIERFAETATAVRAADNLPEDGSLFSRTLSRLTSLVDIRPSASPDAAESGGGTPAILASAQGYLDQGDLAGAATALDGLQGPAAEAAAPWQADAHERMAVGRALEQLRREALVRLSQGAG